MHPIIDSYNIVVSILALNANEVFVRHWSDWRSWSGDRATIPKPSVWKTDALPIELSPQNENRSEKLRETQMITSLSWLSASVSTYEGEVNEGTSKRAIQTGEIDRGNR